MERNPVGAVSGAIPRAAQRTLRNIRVGFAAMALLLLLFELISAWRSWQIEKEHEFGYLSSIARITGNSLDAYFDRYRETLSRLAEELAKQGVENDLPGAQALIRKVVQANPELRRIGITLPDGHILMTDDIKLNGQIPATSSSPSFKLAVEELQRGQSMSIAWTSKSVFNDEWIMPLRSAVRSASGEVLYVLSAALPVAEQQHFWRGIALPPGSSIGMLRDDAYVVSRYPTPTTMSYEETYGTPRSGALTEYLRRNNFPVSGSVEGYNSVAKADYLWAFQRLGAYPITVFVTTPMAQVQAKWLSQFQFSLLLSFMLLGGGYLGYRWIAARLIAWERERELNEAQFERLAFYDSLTHLPNRRLMLNRLGNALASSARHGRNGALMLIDLDNFKALNDTLGHDVGDQLLVEVALRLNSVIRRTDTAARLGGDEFVIILEDLDASDSALIQAEHVALKILAQLGKSYRLRLGVNGDGSERSHECTSSIGISMFREHSVTVDELLKRADTAMYQAKAAGRNMLRFFDPNMQAVVTARAALEVDLRKAIADSQFVLHYQAQVNSSGRVIGAEALVRWQHPERGLVFPDEFIALSEDSGLILPLGLWVLETACSQLANWATRTETAHLTLAVNVSACQFKLPDLVAQVLAVLDRSGAPPDRLKLELTESLLFDNAEDIIGKMNALKARGVGFSLDDFGTGYSSLSYLKRLPLDQLKIDQSFVRDVLSDPNDASIARTIVALAHSLGLDVIAEGVETGAQRDFLANSGCHAYQGYFFSKPVSIDSFEQLLGEATCRPMSKSW